MTVSHHSLVLAGIAALSAIAGCSESSSPQFRLNMVSMVSNELDEAYQREIANVLDGLFGTPDKPRVIPESGLDQRLLELSAGPAWSDEEGIGHGLYRRHCVHCHGISGDGRGPTAEFLNPYPRDYRKGVFKFKSTFNPAKPTDEDLERILHNGIPGSSMPSFSLLPAAEMESLVEYVKYLAIRGETESKLASFVFDELGEEEAEDENGEPILDENGEPKMVRIPFDPAGNPDHAEAVKEIVADVVASWEEASEQIIAPSEDQIPEDGRDPEELADSIAKGRELFFGAKANCVKCHGPTALGDGQQTDFDVWMKEQSDFVAATDQLAKSIERQQEQSELDDDDQERIERDREVLASREAVGSTFLETRNAIPRNLRSGVFRGGNRRIDLFWRIHAGIAGTPMPGVGGSSPGAEGTITEEEMWHIVDYIMSLPYEEPSRPQPALPASVGMQGDQRR